VADPMFNERWHAETMTGMCGDTQSSSIRGMLEGQCEQMHLPEGARSACIKVIYGEEPYLVATKFRLN
jgi:hypothetical protein